MDWKTYSFVIRGRYRRRIVLALKVERTPTQIAKLTEINVSHVSRALSELKGRGIVECITPKENSGKIYRLTEKGKEIKDHIEKSESK